MGASPYRPGGRVPPGGKAEAPHRTTDSSPSRPVDAARGADGVRAGINTNRPTWGLRGGLLWGVPPASNPPPNGPRGLNGRHTYWMSRHPIPGGVAFENFEMRERFHPGQRFIFGITRRTPGELGLGPDEWPTAEGVHHLRLERIRRGRHGRPHPRRRLPEARGDRGRLWPGAAVSAPRGARTVARSARRDHIIKL